MLCRWARIAIYQRVSTDDQKAANQEPECEQLAAQRDEVVARYVETGSAVTRRPAFEVMMQNRKRGRFDVLVVWELDGFGRSMIGN